MAPLASYPFGSLLTIERYRLDNGLTILLVVDASAPVVAYQTWFGVGSRHERPGKTGIAHLFEHLMFNETEKLPYGDYDRRLEEAGADNNAATYLDWTYYLINLPKEALPLAVELESERMQHLVLRSEQLESEREVVSNERRETVDDDVDGVVGELLFSTAFERHGYRFPTIGTMADIEGLTTDDCVAFYGTHYVPNNATLVIVGDVDRNHVLELVEQAYGKIAPASAEPIEPEPEPPQHQERQVQVTLPTESARLAIGYKSPAMADADHVSLTLLNEVLFGGHGSRAHRALVEDGELVSEVAGFVGNFRDPSIWEVFATGHVGVGLEALEAAVNGVLLSMKEQPVSDDELVRACSRLELAALQELETAAGKAEAIGFAELVLGEPDALLTRLAAYRQVTAGDLDGACERYLRSDQRTVVRVTPRAS